MTIDEIFEKMKPIAIYKTGSSLFFTTNKDIDLILVYNTQDEINYYKQIVDGYDIHYRLKENSLFLGSYSDHYIELLKGEDVFERINVFDHREDYIDLLKRYITLFERHKEHYFKSWYHVLACVYILSNNSYSLTQEQLESMQIAHDTQIKQSDKEYCINFIKEQTYERI